MAAMAAKKRPCRECLRWFAPDARVGDRQRTCSGKECQGARRVATQASWRARHPEYDLARRIQERTAAEAEGEAGRRGRRGRSTDYPGTWRKTSSRSKGLHFFWEWAGSSAGTRKTRGGAKLLILQADLRDSPRP